MTVLSIFVAGRVAGLVEGVFFFYTPEGATGGVALTYSLLLHALIGAYVLQRVLPRLAGIEVSYPEAAVAMGLGALAADVIVLAAVHLPSQGSAPGIGINPLASLFSTFGLVSLAIELWVSYRLIVSLAREAHPSVRGVWALPGVAQHADDHDRLTELELEPDGATRLPAGSGWLEVALARTQEAVHRSCSEIGRAPADRAAALALDALTELGTCARNLDHVSSPDPQVRAAVAQLRSGLEEFQAALTEIATGPTVGGRHVYQPGVFLPSMADVPSGEGRRRYELEHAGGLAAIREAFERLSSLGALGDD